MAETILLLGSSGFLGSHLLPFLKKNHYQVVTPRIEIRDYSLVEKTFDEYRPTMVFNATGVTGKPNVDWCETHVQETYSVNVAGSINIAAVAQKKGVYAIQMSSGCVYEGNGPEGGFSEEDPPNFFGSVYSRSRIASEMALKDFPVLQLRIRIPLIGESSPKNLIDKLLHYPAIINRTNSCTVIEDFLPATLALMQQKKTGIYNMTNPGPLTHVEIMEIYQQVVDPGYRYTLMPPETEAKLCERRSNCILSSKKREAAGAPIPDLADSLRQILKKYPRPI